MSAKSVVAFSHDGARDKLISDIKTIYKIDSKVTSYFDKYSKTGGNIHSVEFVLPGDGENIKNIKVNQSTSALHPGCKTKNKFLISIYLNDENKDVIKQLWSNSNCITIGNTMLIYSEFPDKKNFYHGLISLEITSDLNKVSDNINIMIDAIYRFSGFSSSDGQDGQDCQDGQAVKQKSAAATMNSYSNIAKSNILSVSNICIEEEYESEDQSIQNSTSATKSEDYKKCLDLNSEKLKKLEKTKSDLLKESEEIEKQTKLLLERADANSKKLDLIEKSILQNQENGSKIKETIKEAIKNMSALIEAEVKTEVKAEVKTEVKAELKAEVKAEVKALKSIKKKNKNKLNPELETLVEVPVETSFETLVESKDETLIEKAAKYVVPSVDWHEV